MGRELEPSPVPDLSGREAWKYEDYVKAGREVVSRSAWELGDLAAGVPGKYGGATMARFAEDIGIALRTVLDYRRVALAFPEMSRRRDISWSVHRELASLDDRRRVLDGRKSWTKAQALELVRERREQDELWDRALELVDGNRPLARAMEARDWNLIRELTESGQPAGHDPEPAASGAQPPAVTGGNPFEAPVTQPAIQDEAAGTAAPAAARPAASVPASGGPGSDAGPPCGHAAELGRLRGEVARLRELLDSAREAAAPPCGHDADWHERARLALAAAGQDGAARPARREPEGAPAFCARAGGTPGTRS